MGSHDDRRWAVTETQKRTQPGQPRFERLPEPVRLEDTVASQDTSPPPDPEAGRDTDRDFLLRYAP